MSEKLIANGVPATGGVPLVGVMVRAVAVAVAEPLVPLEGTKPVRAPAA